MSKGIRKIGFGLGLALAGLGVGVGQQGAVPPAAGTMQTKMMLCDGLPCIEARLNGGRVLRLALDTGEPTPILDASVARELGLTVEPVMGKDGKPVAGYEKTKVDEVRSGSVRLEHVGFAVADLSDYLKKGIMPKVDGTLAYGMFKDYVVKMDFARNELTVAQGEAGQSTTTSCGAGAMSLITFGSYGPPVVTTTGFAVDGKPVTAQVDTMYSGTLLVYPDAAKTLGLAAPANAKSEMFPFTDGGVEMVRGTAKTESFGDLKLGNDLPLYFAGPKVHVPEGNFMATVGMGLFQGRAITFDYVGNCFKLA
jgi:hypothetical protein